MCHHTRLVQGRLPVQNEDITVTKMSKHLLPHYRCLWAESRNALLYLTRGKQLIGNSRALLKSKSVLRKYKQKKYPDRL